MAGELNIFSNPVYDFEFLGFTFNGKHSSEFGLTVVSPGGFYQENMFSSFEDKTVQVNGKEGVYYFGTEIKTKDFSIQLAFDHLTSENYRKIKEWLSPKKIAKLIFDERPYKYYWVKVSSSPSFSYIRFEEEVDGIITHIFKGELTISFIAHNPYGYSDTNLLSEVEIYTPDYGYIKPYIYGNLPGWYMESGLIDYPDSSIVIASGDNTLDTSTVGTIKKNSVNANFYNCGLLDSSPIFSFTIDAFSTISPSFKITNSETNEYFEISSLKNLTQLSESTALTWGIQCDPTKGLILATVEGVTYNIGAVHNGNYITLKPGNNYLVINKVITNFDISYKNIYW